MSSPGGGTISTDQLKARYIGTGTEQNKTKYLGQNNSFFVIAVMMAQ